MAYQTKVLPMPVRPNRIIASLGPHRTMGLQRIDKNSPGLAGLNCGCRQELGIVPSVYGAAGNMAGKVVGGGSTGNTLSMTGQGAAMGTMIMPGIGTAVGAVVGLVAGLFAGAGKPVRPSAADVQRCSAAVNQYASVAGKQFGRQLGEKTLKDLSWCLQAVGTINFTKDPRFFDSLARWIGQAINNIAKNIMTTAPGTQLTQDTSGMKDDGGKAFKAASISYTNPGPNVSADYVRDSILIPFMVAQCTPYSNASTCRAEYTQPLFLSWLTDYLDWALSQYAPPPQAVAPAAPQTTAQIPVPQIAPTPQTGVTAVSSANAAQIAQAQQQEAAAAAQLRQLQATQAALQQQLTAANAAGNAAAVSQAQNQLAQVQQAQQAAAAQYSQGAAAQVYAQAPAGSSVDASAVAQMVAQQLASQGIQTGGAVSSGVAQGINPQAAGIFSSKNTVLLVLGGISLFFMARSMRNSKGA